jgi:hypothetical protein
MVVMAGGYVHCYAEGKESTRGSMHFILAHLYHFATHGRRRKVEVVYFYIFVCMYMVVGGNGDGDGGGGHYR